MRMIPISSLNDYQSEESEFVAFARRWNVLIVYVIRHQYLCFCTG